MKVLLVNPPGVSQGGHSNPVLGLLYLASYIRDICEVEYIDGFLEGWPGYFKKLMDFQPDLVGTSMLTPGRHASLEVLKAAKDMGAITVVGGPHASIMAGQIAVKYPFVDYIVKSEGETSLKMIIDKGFTERSMIDIDGAKNLLDIDDIPFPAWDMACLDSDKYLGDEDIRIPIIASRGCTGTCAFCSTWKFWKGYRVRSPENVADEIEYIVTEFGKTHFVFEDDAMSCDLKQSKAIMQEIVRRDLGIRFFSTIRADGIDQELAELIKEAGGYRVSVGFESGSQRILNIIGKGMSVEQNVEAARVIKKAGLELCALIIRGNVGETSESEEETRKFLEVIRPEELGTLGVLWILPGTKFYRQMVTEGFVTDDFWLGPEPVIEYRGEIDHLYERKS